MRTIIAVALVVVCASPADVRAEIYKCTDADGSLIFAQTPCSTEKPVTINSPGTGNSAIDCTYANKFAIATARTMQSGTASDQVFNSYGGLGALSNGSIGVINYVYSFRTNDNVTVERIGGLAQAKCKAKGFGDVSCEALPLSFTERLGGCDTEEKDETQMELPMAEPARSPGQTAAVATSTNGLSRAVTTTSDKELTEQCKDRYRDQIDAIDAQMRSGYTSQQGEAYRERLRALTEQMRAC
ncbi:MAG: DUF4124 domain-containing protein [Gammaproteobacteria bacterium]|nr:DUF4124 domain-containing protein [Gammaproteobacteria bacterium]